MRLSFRQPFVCLIQAVEQMRKLHGLFLIHFDICAALLLFILLQGSATG
jgi:hypothetical protein